MISLRYQEKQVRTGPHRNENKTSSPQGLEGKEKMTSQTQTLYRRVRMLECRGAVDPAPSENVEGVLLVGTQAVLSFYDHESSYGEDHSEVFPAFHDGEQQVWLRRDVWCPGRGYSASGTSEYLLSFEEGVKLLIEHEVFSLARPKISEK